MIDRHWAFLVIWLGTLLSVQQVYLSFKFFRSFGVGFFWCYLCLKIKFIAVIIAEKFRIKIGNIIIVFFLTLKVKSIT